MATNQEQAEQAEARDAINREKGRGMAPPKTVEEQVDQLDPGTEEHRRRDPLGGAEQQRNQG